MNSSERRKYVLNKLTHSNDPQKGSSLAEEIGVTRQVIVKDIAILKAEGNTIIATPNGYIMPVLKSNTITRLIAVNHKKEDIENELNIIVENGAAIIDVIVEHSVYGEIKGMLMIKNKNDVYKFMERFNKYNAQPISELTGGVHVHTIEAENAEIIERVIEELTKKGFIARD
ncbi:transcription repressor NadR [Clostridium sp. 19966]|uniref:transcription repressor NadR n=1 Tax=Clostridium sp. 19966 TaxID=2768166 RepID=UPI0028DDD866|nr:transcription repressor NadR [Clostridium sp. 19966]MDT8718879.1 transcription repressor NadR [Clostridium sp. 19966]